MAVYDQFLNNSHSKFDEKMMIKNANNLLEFLFDKYEIKKGEAKALEIGPGKGYFCKAYLNGMYGDYYAMDRNLNMLNNLGINKDRMIEGALPTINTNIKFDIIFVGFVIEHLNNGIELYNCLESIREHLKEDGIAVLQFPDSMKLGMEFYNIDYTHSFPTTKRNVNQAVTDCKMKVVSSIDISGILYTKKIDSKIQYFLRRLIMFFYNYNALSILVYPFYRIPTWHLRNVFWRAYALLKEPNVMFILKVNT